MIHPYVLIGIVGVFIAGIGVGYAIFVNTYNPYSMMQPPAFHQMMVRNQQYAGQWMDSVMQDPQLRQQMYSNMFQNKDFMYEMMSNSTFQNQYMSNWMKQNNYTWHGMMGQSMMYPKK